MDISNNPILAKLKSFVEMYRLGLVERNDIMLFFHNKGLRACVKKILDIRDGSERKKSNDYSVKRANQFIGRSVFKKYKGSIYMLVDNIRIMEVTRKLVDPAILILLYYWFDNNRLFVDHDFLNALPDNMNGDDLILKIESV